MEYFSYYREKNQANGLWANSPTTYSDGDWNSDALHIGHIELIKHLEAAAKTIWEDVEIQNI